MIKNLSRTVLALILVAGLVHQIFEGTKYLSTLFQNKVIANHRHDATIRSADTSFGSEFASYISFLRTSIPEGSKVLIPPTKGLHYFLNDRPLMQYFLFPRQILQCQSDCSEWYLDPNVFIVSQDGFPQASSIPSSKQFIPFSDNLGLYITAK